MSEKKSSRTIINLIGIPSLLTIIVFGDSFIQLPIFSIFIGIVLVLGIKEIPILVKGLNGQPFLLILIIFISILQIDRHPTIMWDISVSNLLIGLTISAMTIEIFRNKQTPFLNITAVIFAFIWLGLMLGSLVTLRNMPMIGFSITLSLFLSVWICDTAAFGFGLKFGKRKILPKISPKKTWVGSISGLTVSVILMMILHKFNFFTYHVTHFDAFIIGLISGIFGQLGDFAESLLKREANIKDTSNLLKGHGGILDRFDSLTFASPIVLIYCNYFIKIG
tara:strand:+ start:119 stop:955 length:837 start_codon:yes stop_codon:yes gene_type:complete